MVSKRLLLKFLFIYGAIYAAAACVAIPLILRWERDQYSTQLQVSLARTAGLVVAELSAEPGLANDIQATAKDLGKRFGARVTLMDAKGRVIADSEETPETLGVQQDQPEMKMVLRQATGWSIRGEPGNRSEMAYLVRRTQGIELPHYVRVGLPWQPYQAVLDQLRDRLLGLAVMGGVALVAVTAGLVGPLASRAARLADVALAVKEGDFNTAIAVDGQDELATLAKNFQQMRLELAAHIDRLRKNSDRLAVVLGTMTEGVVAIDNRGIVLFANRAARMLLEFATPDPIGRAFVEAVRNRSVHEAVQAALERDDAQPKDLELGGTVRRTVAMQIRQMPGVPSPGALLVLHDVTELRRLENLRQEFVANVSHELKTPLTVIKAYAETLLEGAIKDPRNNVSFVKQIADQAERLHQLIIDLLSVARIESGHERFNVEPVAIRGLVKECVDRYAATAEAKQVNLAQEPGQDGVSVFADEEGMREILDNLVDNAIKYTPRGGRVRLSWEPEDGLVRIDVADTGIGIPADHQSRIFERFYRVDKARSRELGGTGLGLSIVKHLVSAFGGTIAVRSEVNQGTTFTVRLPRSE